MPTFTRNGTKLYYEETGTGTPLVLLHGLFGSHASFGREAEQLKDSFRVITPDARGHGQSDKPREYTLNDHIEDTIALLDHLNVEKAHVLGVSMGSYIAQGLVLAHPDRVDKLILVVSKPSGKTSSTLELFKRHADEIKGMEQQQQLDYMAQYIYHKVDVVNERLEEIAEPELTLPQQGSANKALEGFDFRPVLPTVTSPTLVISGTHDGLNPPERGKEIAGFVPNAQFMEFEKSGHAPHIEEAERFMTAVMEFLGK